MSFFAWIFSGEKTVVEKYVKVLDGTILFKDFDVKSVSFQMFMVETNWEFWVNSETSVVLSSHMNHSSKTYWRFHLKGTFCPSTWTHFPCLELFETSISILSSTLQPPCVENQDFWGLNITIASLPPPGSFPPSGFFPCLLPIRLVATGRKSDGVELISLTEGMDEVEVPRINGGNLVGKCDVRLGSWDGKGK